MTRDLYSLMLIGLSATVWIVAMKLILTKYYVPGLSEIYAMA